MLKGGGGGTTSFEVFLTQELEVLAILMGGGLKRYAPFKMGARNDFYLVLRGECKKFLDQRFSPFDPPPPPPLPVFIDRFI